VNLIVRQLTQIANECRTDKGTVPGMGHGYTPLYELLLTPFREREIDLLEIGLSAGGPEVMGRADRAVTDFPSIRMWREFFPKAHITGVDISDFSRFETTWFKFFRADCGSAEQLHNVAELSGPQDLIVDDGSHAPFHQQLTLCSLFPILKPGGLYFIEDLNWQPEAYEKSLPSVPRTDRLLADFVRTGRFENTGAIERSRWDAVAKRIANIFLFDEDYLYEYRRLYNIRAGLQPEIASYVDIRFPRRLLKPGYLRRLVEDLRTFLNTAVGRVGPSRRPRIKLAVIQAR
jgi:hypothetical protein